MRRKIETHRHLMNRPCQRERVVQLVCPYSACGQESKKTVVSTATYPITGAKKMQASKCSRSRARKNALAYLCVWGRSRLLCAAAEAATSRHRVIQLYSASTPSHISSIRHLVNFSNKTLWHFNRSTHYFFFVSYVTNTHSKPRKSSKLATSRKIGQIRVTLL